MHTCRLEFKNVGISNIRMYPIAHTCNLIYMNVPLNTYIFFRTYNCTLDQKYVP